MGNPLKFSWEPHDGIRMDPILGSSMMFTGALMPCARTAIYHIVLGLVLRPVSLIVFLIRVTMD